MARILIVEENADVSGLLSANLNMFGYQTFCVSGGRQAMRAIRAQRFDLALCDLALSESADGAWLSVLKAQGVPVILVGGGMEARPDAPDACPERSDVIRPANIRALMARMEALLRHAPQRVLVYRDISVNEETRTVAQNGREVILKPMEYALLITLLRHPGVTMTREELLLQVWGDATIVATRTVDVHVAALRRKLGLGRYLTTVYRTGYRLENG